MLVLGVLGETVISYGFVSQGVPLSLGLRFRFGTVGRSGFAYAGAREVFRKVEKQTLHWMSLAVSLTLSWDLASLPAFFAARSRFCADLAPCVCEQGGQRSAIRRLGWGRVVMGDGKTTYVAATHFEECSGELLRVIFHG